MFKWTYSGFPRWMGYSAVPVSSVVCREWTMTLPVQDWNQFNVVSVPKYCDYWIYQDYCNHQPLGHFSQAVAVAKKAKSTTTVERMSELSTVCCNVFYIKVKRNLKTDSVFWMSGTKKTRRRNVVISKTTTTILLKVTSLDWSNIMHWMIRKESIVNFN